MKPTVGSGSRFDVLEDKLDARGGVRDPRALAAYIGRQKYGAAKMASWAARGRARSKRDMVRQAGGK